MGCRKDRATLTAAEKTAFVNAVPKLKTAVPNHLHLGDPNLHRYDDYVEVHMNARMLMNGAARGPGWAHKGPAFFPWHRENLRHFEADLQQIESNTALPWTDDFMGAMDPATQPTCFSTFPSPWKPILPHR